jgi:hypothetical protein
MANEQPYVIQAPAIRDWGLVKSRVFVPVHGLSSRTPLSKQTIVSPTSPSLRFLPAVMLWQASDVALGNSFVASNKDYLFVWNSGGSTFTITLRSVPEQVFSRSGDLTLSLIAGQMDILGPITKAGWMQGDGNIYLDASDASVKVLPVVFS